MVYIGVVYKSVSALVLLYLLKDCSRTQVTDSSPLTTEPNVSATDNSNETDLTFPFVKSSEVGKNTFDPLTGECLGNYWGVDCNNTCPPTCLGGNCSSEFGNCSSCEPGWNLGPNSTCDDSSPLTTDVNTTENNIDLSTTMSRNPPGLRFLITNATGAKTHKINPLTGGCIGNYWGVYCNNTCSQTCLGGKCSSQFGNCSSCEHRWKLGLNSMCDECVDGLYGELCDKKCPENCGSPDCEKPTGRCFSCKPGKMMGTKGNCSKNCLSGHWGDGCKLLCSGTCINKECDPVHGACYSCYPRHKLEGTVCKEDNTGLMLGVLQVMVPLGILFFCLYKQIGKLFEELILSFTSSTEGGQGEDGMIVTPATTAANNSPYKSRTNSPYRSRSTSSSSSESAAASDETER